MTDHATQQVIVRASPEHCFDVVTDFDSYLQWASDLKEVSVLERDAEGRATKVAFRAAAFGRSTSYTLQYDYSKAPKEVSWNEIEGDLTSRLDGAYIFNPTQDGDTEVTYNLLAELKVPIPVFVKRRAESKIIGTALRNLKSRVESS